jgi:very-short-patch-repair endonuclease
MPSINTIPMIEYRGSLRQLACNLRSNMTDSERKLWHHLRRDQLGVRFYRQRILGPYIVDFYSPLARLVVEVDGDHHYEPSH